MPWDTEEFVPLDDFDGTVVQSIWKQGLEGSTQLELTIQVHEVYAPAEAGNPGETKAWYSAGRKGWDIVDGGLRVIPAQQGQRFHANSKVGMLLDRVAKELNLDVVVGKGEPEEAVIWIGERFRWQRVAQSYAGLAGAEGEEKRNVETSILLPVEYRTAGVATAPQPAAGAPDQPVQPTAASFAIADTDLVIIQALAKSKSSDGKGQAVRIAIAREPRLNENVPLMEALLNNPDAIVELEAAGKLVVQNGVYQ